MRKQHIALMAEYNAWMNTKILDASSKLSDEALLQDRNAFFGSILGTLNHLIVADIYWLNRFATFPVKYQALNPVLTLEAPKALNQMICSDIRNLAAQRTILDHAITKMAEELSENDLDFILNYTNSQGVVSNKPFYSVLMHFFNHQTHHRGQVTTLLSQAGVDIGVTDLVTLIPNVA